MPAPVAEPTAARRRQWRVVGQVQGVGFRPRVFRLATSLGLTGWVRNDRSGVTIEAQGAPGMLDLFERTLAIDLPPLASIDALVSRDLGPADPVEHAFRIEHSDDDGRARARVTVDSVTCDACRRELLEPADRRRGHALINCTDCGPRYTIVRATPYDRANTTMSSFPMCDRCAHEFEDPADRRFHAQPNCCHDCGPRLELIDAAARPIEGDPIEHAARLIRGGGVVAIKGLGGYHLACDATSERAVATLRARKRRDHKAFAVMVGDLDAARALAEFSSDGEACLTSHAGPIVLAPARTPSPLAAGVAPGLHRVGVMLPTTPIHHLLVAAGLPALVMTSANASDDPLVRDDAEALERLAGVADAYLRHDRPIARAVDDSVVLDTGRGPVVVRRARGYVPSPVPISVPAALPGLAAGAELKNTVALVAGDRVILSQHIGDLTHTLAWRRFENAMDDLERLFEVRPAWIACDPHPGYRSRRAARRYARAHRLPLLEVQHHHAHLASVLAEHGRRGPVVGVIADGVGYGSDGTAWGGEILAGDLIDFRRLGRVRPLPLPGGDAAAKQTGRCAAAWLFTRFGEQAREHPAARRALPDRDERSVVFAMLRHGVNAPLSSGLGRLFDAASSALGVCDFNHHEAMSGQLLEALASVAGERPSGSGLMTLGEAGGLLELDHGPLLDRLLAGLERGEPVGSLAWVFHDAVADGLARAAIDACERSGLCTVALSGGVFVNELMTDLVASRLELAGFEVLTNRDVPPNDGGLSYGQAAVAAARLERGV